MMGIKRGYLQYKYQYYNIFLLFVKKPNGIDKKKRKKKKNHYDDKCSNFNNFEYCSRNYFIVTNCIFKEFC